MTWGCLGWMLFVDPKVLANIRKITAELRAEITSVAVPPGSPGQPGSKRADRAIRGRGRIIRRQDWKKGNFTQWD